MTCGIYILRFNNTNKVYIGQSLNIESRLVNHIYKMRKGINSKNLNEAYALYGAPILEVLLECDVSELDIAEKEAINIFNATNKYYGFNSFTEAGGGSTTSGEEHSNSKFTNDSIIEVFEYLIQIPVVTFEDISAITGVSIPVIADISKGNNHTWLKEKFPEKYRLLMTLKNNRKAICYTTTDKLQVISPTGAIFNIDNIRAFAREHGLYQSHLGKLLKGQAKSHKGWKRYEGELS